MAAPKAKPLTAPVCVNCKDPVGAEVKVVPFVVNEDDGTGGGKPETWCPACFVGTRVRLEPHRFHPSRYVAVRCAACGLTSVDVGQGCCNQCRSRRIVLVLSREQAAALLAAAGG